MCVDPAALAHLLQALGELHPHFLAREPVISIVKEALRDPVWEVRTQAVRVLGSLDSRDFRAHARSKLEDIARGSTGENSSAVKGAASEALLIQSQEYRQRPRPAPRDHSTDGHRPESDLPFDSRSMALLLRSLWPRALDEWGFFFVCLYAAACFWCPNAVMEGIAILTFAA